MSASSIVVRRGPYERARGRCMAKGRRKKACRVVDVLRGLESFTLCLECGRVRSSPFGSVVADGELTACLQQGVFVALASSM